MNVYIYNAFIGFKTLSNTFDLNLISKTGDMIFYNMNMKYKYPDQFSNNVVVRTDKYNSLPTENDCMAFDNINIKLFINKMKNFKIAFENVWSNSSYFDSYCQSFFRLPINDPTNYNFITNLDSNDSIYNNLVNIQISNEDLIKQVKYEEFNFNLKNK